MKSQATRIRPKRENTFFADFAQLLQSSAQFVIYHKSRTITAAVLICVTTLMALMVQGFSSESGVSTTSIKVPADENPPAVLLEQVQVIDEPVDIELAIATEPEPADPFENLQKQVARVKSGDSLSLIFDRMGFTPRQLYEVVSQSEHGEDIGRLYPGRELTFYSNESNELIHLEYRLNPLQAYLVDKTESGYQSEFEVRQPESYSAIKSGVINSSFYLAGLDAGLSDNLIMELAAIFGWDIDFALEIRTGDTFSVVYEDQYLDGEPIGVGNILAAEFVNRGNSYRAIRHTDQEGRSAYYTPEGESMRKAFLRTPLDVFWISSHFNPNRKHPILDVTRPHQGTDYAANTGSPIRATGDGKVASARYSSSYGNVVEIQHGQNYRTLYAHMNNFASGIRTGATVRQGQIIGYVGMTGLAQGPHLHYEFHVNGSVRNPVTVDLPNGAPLAEDQLASFKLASAKLIQLLDNPAVQYAEDSPSADNPS